MADAYKCQDCGEVVMELGNCPSCGGNSMRPTRVPESELPSNDRPGDEATTDATESEPSGDSDNPEPSGTDDAVTTSDDATGDSDDTAAGSRERDGTRRERTDEGVRGGLLAWLKSLF